MRFVVFGATGRTGRHFVAQALAARHDVTAFVRSISRQTIDHARLRSIEGALDQPEQLAEAISGQDAVINTLGSGGGTLTVFAKTLVPEMTRLNLKRLVSLVGAAVPDPHDQQSFGRLAMQTLMRIVARDVIADASAHAEVIRQSALDWTLVRPPRLTDGPLTGNILSNAYLPLGPLDSISRADLAAFMLDVASNAKFVRQAPMATSPKPG